MKIELQKIMQREQRVSMIGLLLVVIFLLAIIFYYFSMQYHLNVNHRREQVIKIAHGLDRHVASRMLSLNVLARGLTDLRHVSEIKNHLQQANMILNLKGTGIYSLSGQLLVRTASFDGRDVNRNKKYFQNVISGQSIVSNRRDSSKFGADYIDYFVPVVDQFGEVNGILVAEEAVFNMARSIETLFAAQDEQYIYVVDRNGRFIYHPRYEKLYANLNDIQQGMKVFSQNRSGTVVTNSFVGGYDKAYIYTAVDNTNWRVVMATPVYHLYLAVLKQSLPEIFMMFLLFMLAGSVFRSRMLIHRHREEIENERFDRLSCVSQLSAVLAHEIRNPITCVKGYLQLIERKKDQAVSSQYIDIMLNELQRIEDLVNEFRSLAKPMRKPCQNYFNFTGMIQNIIMLMEGQALDKGVVLNYYLQRDIYINGDIAQLKQVIINLLKNAIEAEKSGGKVLVELAEENEWVVFSVKDTGKGMPQDVLKNIGRPFFTTKDGGTGLGLSVCFSIIQQHRGKIRIGSLAGFGTSIIVYLPRAEHNSE